MSAKYPIIIQTALPFKTAEKIKKIVEEQNSSLSKVVREIVEKYFELNEWIKIKNGK